MKCNPDNIVLTFHFLLYFYLLVQIKFKYWYVFTMHSQYKLKTAVVKLKRIDPYNYLKNKSDSDSSKSGSDGASDGLNCLNETKRAPKRRSDSSKNISKMESLFDYDNEAQIGINSFEYNLLRRQVEKSGHPYNLRKSNLPVEKIEFKYDLYKSARQENINYLLTKMNKSPDSPPKKEIKLEKSADKKSKLKKSTKVLPQKKVKNELKEMAETIEAGLTEENDKVAHYNVIATIEEENILTIKYFQTFESGTILMNVDEHVLKGDKVENNKFSGKNSKKSSLKKKKRSPKSTQPRRKKMEENLGDEKKFYYKYEMVELPNGKLKGKLSVSEREFKSESSEKFKEVSSEAPDKLKEVLSELPEKLKEGSSEAPDKLKEVSSESNEKITNSPEKTLPVEESDPFLDDLCTSLLNQGEIDQGLIDPDLNLNKEKFEFDVDADGFIETFSSNINNNIELPKNVCDANVDLNEKMRKVFDDLNSYDVIKKKEAVEAMKLINKLLNYK